MNIKKDDYDHLRNVVGSLMIKQFKGKDRQDQYRAVINMIFEQFLGKAKPIEHWTELTVTPKQ